MIAQVIVDVKHEQVNQLYDYVVPDEFIPFIQVGMRVFVSFQHVNISAIILNLIETSTSAVKSIDAIDTLMPILSTDSIDLVNYLVDRFGMLYQQALDLVVPTIFHLKYHYIIEANRVEDIPLNLKHYFNRRHVWKLKKSEHHFLKQLKSLQVDGIVSIDMRSDQLKTSQVTLTQEKSISSTKKHHETFYQWSWQSEDWKGLKEALLTANSNEKTLILVPTIYHISLLPKFILELPHVIYHSKLSPKQKIEVYQQLKQSHPLIIGTRHTLLWTFEEISNIIMIDPREDAYDIQQGVQFNTIEIIQHLSELHDYHVSYVSPMMTTKMNYLIQQGMSYVKGPSIHSNIHLINMKQQLLEGHTKVLSKPLLERLNLVKVKGERVFMLYPQKGLYRYHMCRICGEMSECPSCHAHLYVTRDHSLKCPQCQYETPLHDTCSLGHTHMMQPIKSGIESIQQQIENILNVSVTLFDQKHPDVEGFVIGTQNILPFIGLKQPALVVCILADLLWQGSTLDREEQAYHTLFMMTNKYHENFNGETWIQTYQTNHRVIQALNDETHVMDAWLEEKELLLQSPFFETIQLSSTHERYLVAYQEAYRLKEILQSLVHVLGPTIDPHQDQTFLLTVKYKLNQFDHIMKITKQFPTIKRLKRGH
jgi:primosomal protein N'